MERFRTEIAHTIVRISNQLTRGKNHGTAVTPQAMRAILEVQPEATFIQSESSEYFHAEDPL